MDLMHQNLLTITLCAYVSVAGLVRESPLCVPLQWCGKFWWGEGLLMVTEGGGG